MVRSLGLTALPCGSQILTILVLLPCVGSRKASYSLSAAVGTASLSGSIDDVEMLVLG